jgi:ABC-type multidrug transport system ATPase subunit/ABC-type multidrug transport system permease subunit
LLVEPLDARVPVYCNGRPLVGLEPLKHGDILRAGNCWFELLFHEDISTQTADDVTLANTIPISDLMSALTMADMAAPKATKSEPAPAAVLPAAIPLLGRMRIGRDNRAEIPLLHPQVSRRHAEISLRRDGRAELRDLSSANGTFVNGRRLTRPPVLLAPGDHLNIGPYALEFTGAELASLDPANIELVARDIRRVVSDRQTGKPLTLLDGVTLVFRPREFVCLLGPSGCGKTTLMAALSGRLTPDDGVVLLNGQNLHASFDALKQDIALVPQRDVLHFSLTVGQALRYTAKLRLPPDTSAAEADNCIAEMLDTVKLTHRHRTPIRLLSGGEVKRASLANEILCRPRLLFLDEVTSGLDEQTDREMMDLFRSVAKSGKTVICITHSLANVERACDLVVILAPGGKTAFVGSPAEALAYFGIERLGDVYSQLERESPEHWQQKFLASPMYAKYVQNRLPRRQAAAARLIGQPRAGLIKTARQFVRQSLLCSMRYQAILSGDPLSLLAMLVQVFVVAALLVAVFGNVRDIENPAEKVSRAVSLLFLTSVSCFWFGCNNAAKEIVRERTIFTRERDFNLLAGSYYVSKLAVLSAISSLQTILVYVVVRAVCGPPGDIGQQVIILLSLAVAGTTLGLLISTVSKNEEMAVTLVPIAVIPQIVLSGSIAPVNGVARWIAYVFVTTYWGKRGLDALLPDDLASLARAAEIAVDGTWLLALFILAVHTLVFMTATIVMLTLQSRKAALVLHQIKRVVRRR